MADRYLIVSSGLSRRDSVRGVTGSLLDVRSVTSWAFRTDFPRRAGTPGLYGRKALLEVQLRLHFHATWLRGGPTEEGSSAAPSDTRSLWYEQGARRPRHVAADLFDVAVSGPTGPSTA